MSMWIGKEREGDLKGIQTLFISNRRHNFLKISNVLEKYDDIKQIYFGAGGCTKIDYGAVKECIKKLDKNYIITLEIDIRYFEGIPSEFNGKVNVILTIKNLNFSNISKKHLKDYNIKIQGLKYHTGILAVKKLKDFIFTNVKDLNHNKYSCDTVITR